MVRSMCESSFPRRCAIISFHEIDSKLVHDPRRLFPLAVKGSQFDTDNDKNLFYWFFEKRTTSQRPPDRDGVGLPRKRENGKGETTPLVVWLTGGPGCSSSLALLTENGPCEVNKDGATTKVNPYSWIESAHVLWLDQPANVGK
jgi:carboxypeptidase C (cathepsin A)